MSAQPLDIRFNGQDRKTDSNLRTLVGWMIGQTAVIIGAIASVAFALRH
ncbi:MAG TPA: hypothetical protein VK702_08430 [Candidatus Acidoferrum sp.]|jgi:hypothetical protein|nr:hypothetical protein [Candidatus Acidoferrum sp.]